MLDWTDACCRGMLFSAAAVLRSRFRCRCGPGRPPAAVVDMNTLDGKGDEGRGDFSEKLAVSEETVCVPWGLP